MKKSILAAIFVIIMIVSTACNEKEASTAPVGGGSGSERGANGSFERGQGRNAAARSESGAITISESGQRQRPQPAERDSGEEAGEGSAEKNSITGTVKSIVGNEILLVTGQGDGDEQSYLLPVGMSIGSKDFSVVKAGDRLRITFGEHPDDGSEIITAVAIIK